MPAIGNFNIEVFTAFGVTTLPTLDPGFQAGIIDPGGTLIAPGFHAWRKSRKLHLHYPRWANPFIGGPAALAGVY